MVAPITKCSLKIFEIFLALKKGDLVPGKPAKKNFF
jgi:hypothetical protein